MKPSNIGGQAVMEGIMMRHKDKYAVAVRRPDKEIELKVEDYKCTFGKASFLKKPIIRGVVSFVDGLVVGTKCLMYSAEIAGDEEDEEEAAKNAKLSEEELSAKKEKEAKQFQWLLYITVAISIVVSVAAFMLLPYALASLLRKVGASEFGVTVAEAFVKLALFLGYMFLISRMKDIQRTFMYHGAEHKCINCVEHGMPLTVENVMASSRQHKRCGTSFLFFVLAISIILLMLIQVESPLMRVIVRIALIPVIAGISYEVLKLAGRSENPIINLLSRPGLAIQKLTTKEPTADMVEVAIKAVEAVDECVGKAVEALKEVDGQMFICADHGNAEQLIDEETGEPFTAHTTNPVPFILVNADPAYKLREGGCLADIAPTLIELMGTEQPKEMNGTSLLVK